jgi:hypothetical protein
LTADAEVPRLEGLASHATTEVETAKANEAEALATYPAEVTPERLDKTPKAETEAAVKEIGEIIARVAEQTEARNAAIRQAVKDAGAAGVVPGAQNDERVSYGIDSLYPYRRSISVDGASYAEAVPERLILHVITQAIEAAGYRLASPGFIEVRKRD